jgi:RNA polymerase sigma factor for flagellar operon FliA
VTVEVRGPGAGQTTSTEDLILTHMALVERIVGGVLHRVPQHVSRDELTSAGLAALVASAHAYDPGRGVPFTGFAATRIRGSLLDELRQMDWATRAVRRRAREIEAARAELTTTLNRIPTAAELAAHLSLAPEDVTAVAGDTQRAAVLSLDGIVDVAPSESAGPEEQVLRREQDRALRTAVASLPERQRTVVVGCYFEEKSTVDMARRMGVSQSRVSQLRSEALRSLRRSLGTRAA